MGWQWRSSFRHSTSPGYEPSCGSGGMAWPSTSSPSSPGIFLDHPAPPHHHELSRLWGLPPAPSVAGGSRIICLVNAQVPSRRSAARRRDKESVVSPAVFLSSVFRRILPHQRLRRTRPSVPAPPGRETPSIYRGTNGHHPLLPQPPGG